MTLTNCPYCGTKLIETNKGRIWCPNCGIVQEESEDVKDADRSYIG